MLNRVIHPVPCRLPRPLWAAFTLLICCAATAQVPTVFNYQGRLLQNTALQAPVDTSVDIVFSIWSGPAGDPGANQLWTESWNGVGLANGIFSVLLGSNGSPLNPADFQGASPLFLQLEIDGELLLPRQQLGSVPFAMVDEPANELQNLSLSGNILGLSDSADSVDLAPYLDNTDNQQLSLNGNNLQLTSDDGNDVVDLAAYTNTDEQTLALSGNTLSISGSGSSVNLGGFLDNTDQQTLGLSGTTLSISGSGSSVSLNGLLDNTDNQNLSNVLTQGNDGGGRNITNLGNIQGTGLDCPDCVDTADIDDDSIRGNDITDNIYILHIDCNGECSDMSMRAACDVIEDLRGLSVETELISVSCVHHVPSTSGNGFVACNDSTGSDNECRAFNLRTLGDIPCIDGDGTDALVTCLETNIAK